MDTIDQKLLQILHENSRISIVDISRKINLSRPSVKERIDKLVEKGTIKSFTIQTNLNSLNESITFFSELSQVSLSMEKIIPLLKNTQQVNEVHIISGEVNYLVKATVTNTSEMKDLLSKWMVFAKVKSSIILDTPIENQFHFNIED
ncbi:Lrp/AsnC family transcriptional regulator [Enterococcus termitis]|uniref:AsnC family transcriptional regulator n=1 Tax=Enterococcus termitis TaxID=332950 RepID=A0A1E5G7Z5_9ENTE|nr:Lrp/AsnC family transcriptional regulator [Enterococcus termitis]OEG08771.1 AsnC family transcriptional regulator [Enterococcus termitis]